MTGLSRITGIRSNLCFNKKILFVENEDKFEKEEGEILEHSAHTMNLPPANVGSEIGQQEKTAHDLEEGQSLESRQSTTRGKLDNRKSFTIQRLESDSAKKKFEDSESYFFNNGMYWNKKFVLLRFPDLRIYSLGLKFTKIFWKMNLISMIGSCVRD